MQGISEATKDILAPMKAHGGIGGEPFGWQETRDGIHFDANAKEQALVQAALEPNERGLSLWQFGHALDNRARSRFEVALDIASVGRTYGRWMAGRSEIVTPKVTSRKALAQRRKFVVDRRAQEKG
jgi:hypothetical protein